MRARRDGDDMPCVPSSMIENSSSATGDLIPIALDIDRRPITGSDGFDTVFVFGEPVPGIGAGIDDLVVVVPHGGAEFVRA